VVLRSNVGGIRILGEGLKMGALDLDAGKVTVCGTICGVLYAKTREEMSVRHKSKSVISRLLR